MVKSSTGKYFEGIGRRKAATARVRVFAGEAASTVNDKPVDVYFSVTDDVKAAMRPFVVTGLIGKYYFTAKVTGGGNTGQSDAVKLGLARALFKMDENLKSDLKVENLLTRDPRVVERKKYGLKKARKKPQFSKR